MKTPTDSDDNRPRKWSPGTRAKISAAMTGRKVNPAMIGRRRDPSPAERTAEFSSLLRLIKEEILEPAFDQITDLYPPEEQAMARLLFARDLIAALEKLKRPN